MDLYHDLNLTGHQLRGVGMPFVALTDGATVAWDVTDISFANAVVTIAGNRALAISGAVAGSSGLLKVVQGAGGNFTLSLPTNSKAVDGGGGVLALSGAAGAVDFLSFVCDGTNYYWTYGRNFT